MTIPALSQRQMIAILNANGYDTVSTKYWEANGVERIIMGNGISRFTLKLKKFYFFPEVVKRCQMLDITINDIPEDIREEYQTCFDKYLDEQSKWVTASNDSDKESKEGE